MATVLGLPVATVRDWHAGKLPTHSRPREPGAPGRCDRCGHLAHQFAELSDRYAYLLGMYLGDGTISAQRRGVHRLRVFLDCAYPAIVGECERAIAATLPGIRPNRRRTDSNCFEVYAYSKQWPCLFPQCGPGLKHTRRIWLSEWQQELAERWPEALIRGLIHSDGSRSINHDGRGWSAPRYSFTNVSSDITSIFCTACDLLGLRWTASFPRNERAAVSIYVSRKEDVARMDEFVGPKA